MTTTIDLTPRERDALAFIYAFTHREGWAPTLTELAAGMGVVARHTVLNHVNGLARKGAIRRGVPGSSRTIAILEPGYQAILSDDDRIAADLRELVQVVAEVRGRRGRDFVRSRILGKTLDALDKGDDPGATAEQLQREMGELLRSRT